MANAGKVIGKGVTIELEGNVYRVDDFQHVKPGKGAAFIRTRLKNIKTGGVVEKTFRPTEDVETAHVDRSEKQYLYNDGDLYYFMDTETYDQIPISKEQMEDAILYLRENDEATLKFYKGVAFLVEPPNSVILKVVETEPGVKGDTATNVTKPATVETGAVVQVPIFIDEGENIQIDTRTGEYLGRAK